MCFNNRKQIYSKISAEGFIISEKSSNKSAENFNLS